jgi:hypothetical protein
VSRCVLDGIIGAKPDMARISSEKLTDNDIEYIRLSIMRELTDYIDFGTNDK